jgi:hypothetical protein
MLVRSHELFLVVMKRGPWVSILLSGFGMGVLACVAQFGMRIALWMGSVEIEGVDVVTSPVTVGENLRWIVVFGGGAGFTCAITGALIAYRSARAKRARSRSSRKTSRSP